MSAGIHTTFFAEPRDNPGVSSACTHTQASSPRDLNFRNGAHAIRFLQSCGLSVSLDRDQGTFTVTGGDVDRVTRETIRVHQFVILKTLRRIARIKRHRSERELLHALLVNPGLVLRECEKRGVKPESFADVRHQHIFWGLREMHLNRQVAVKAFAIGLKPNRAFLQVDLCRLAETLRGQVERGYVLGIAGVNQPEDLIASIKTLAGSSAAGVRSSVSGESASGLLPAVTSGEPTGSLTGVTNHRLTGAPLPSK